MLFGERGSRRTYDPAVTSLILLNGPPASGKSTIARWFVNDRPGALALDIDVIRGLIGGWADDPVGSGLTARVHALTMASMHLRTGLDVVVPQFLGKVDFILELADLAGSEGVRFIEVVLRMEKEEARQAFDERTNEGAEQTHLDAALLVQRSNRADPLGEMFDDLEAVVEQRPATVLVDVIRGDIASTCARFSEVVS